MRRFVLVSFLTAVTCSSPAAALAEEILGTVAKVDGKTVTITSESELLPVDGDAVAIFVEIEGIGKAEVGTAKVTSVDGGNIIATIDSTTARVQAGHLVTIQSQNPTRRAGAKVPILIGRVAADAKKVVADAGFEAEFRIGMAAPRGVKAFTIYAQDPAPGSELASGGKIVITLYAAGDSSDSTGAGTDMKPLPPPPTVPPPTVPPPTVPPPTITPPPEPTDSPFPPWPTIETNQPWLGVSRFRPSGRNVVIYGVLADGPAGKAGLRVNDTVLSIDGKETRTIAKFHEAFEAKRPGDQVAVEIERDGKRDFLNVVLEAIPPDGGNGRILALAQAGEGWAMAEIGLRYANFRSTGSYCEKDDAQALNWLRRADQAGETSGTFFLAFMYRNGRGVEQDYAKAMELYERVRSLESAEGKRKGLWNVATESLASMHLNGQGISQDYEKAFALYQESADRGSLSAKHQVALMYYQGQGVEKNLGEAQRLFREAAEEGLDKAQVSLGAAYANGDGVARDASQAVHWYRAAAEQDYADGQYNLGVMYMNGQGVTQDYDQASTLLRKAADAGHAFAQNNLGVLYENGWGVNQDYAEAAKLYRSSAEAGNATAQNNLGVMYQNGRGVAQDYGQAAHWYRQAADQGEASGQDNTGWLLQYGMGVARNYSEAVVWYRRAADQGHALGQAHLGFMYINGLGVEKDGGEAAKWLNKAALQNEATAQYNLGLMAYKGIGVKQNYTTALGWFNLAAKGNNADAINYLGVMYENAHGVSRDYAKALEYYDQAIGVGSGSAAYNKGQMHLHGRGVRKRIPTDLFSMAADRGLAEGHYMFAWCLEEEIRQRLPTAPPRDEANRMITEHYRKAAELGVKEANDALRRLGVR
ncbi:MAG: SEL1-like repeat protein [Planctomycetes bacterium]|nr:SEL1-like repeat protein [Planctomycetota bacterium]MBL7039684.1 SEL1-like repeat protein [Pirellulaceae bacterium]